MPASIEAQEHAVDRAAKVFALVKQAALRRLPCPSNADLAERFAVKPNTISRAFNFLEANGMIQIERGQCDRVVTICATGDRTSGIISAEHHTRRAA